MPRGPSVLFAGPTTHGLPAACVSDAVDVVRPPARRGDVSRLIAEQRRQGRAPGTLVICDGAFQQVAALGHAELCDALDAGWQVWGVASLGAIRAWEMRHEGMRGHGRVHARFARVDDLPDDELTLLHAPMPPWFPLSEALVEVRMAIEALQAEGAITAAAADAVVRPLAGMWFADRTEARLRALVDAACGAGSGMAQRVVTRIRTDAVKRSDLASLLALAPWRTAGATTAARTPPSAARPAA